MFLQYIIAGTQKQLSEITLFPNITCFIFLFCNMAFSYIKLNVFNPPLSLIDCLLLLYLHRAQNRLFLHSLLSLIGCYYILTMLKVNF